MKTMKKTAFSVCAAALLLFSACSKDDDEKNVSEMSVTEMNSMIIGTWNYTNSESWDSDGAKNTNSNDGAEKLTFNSDGKYTWLENGGDRATGTYWITNKKELILDEDYYDYYNDTLTIESLTKTELILISEDRDEDDWWKKTRSYYKKIN